MSPEFAVRPPWRSIFRSEFLKNNLAIIAVDEVHCIPEWFGSTYRYGILKNHALYYIGVLTSGCLLRASVA